MCRNDIVFVKYMESRVEKSNKDIMLKEVQTRILLNNSYVEKMTLQLSALYLEVWSHFRHK